MRPLGMEFSVLKHSATQPLSASAHSSHGSQFAFCFAAKAAGRRSAKFIGPDRAPAIYLGPIAIRSPRWSAEVRIGVMAAPEARKRAAS
jgi:hypothetical protein